MRTHRLARLARLTHGAALVGVGLFDASCKKEDPPVEPPHINATATPTTEPPAASDAGLQPPTINAPPTPPDAGIMRHTVNATATPPPSGGKPPKL